MQKPIYAREKVFQSPFPSERNIEKLATTVNRFELFATPEMQAIARIEASLLRGARKYFDSNDFTEIIVPHLTKATGACENIATMFTVDHFSENCYLAQTGQLYLEVLTPYLKKVWCIGPSFRAEPAVDERHLTEFTLIELESEGDLWQLVRHIEERRQLTGLQLVLGVLPTEWRHAAFWLRHRTEQSNTIRARNQRHSSKHSISNEQANHNVTLQIPSFFHNA